jgi:hypothetical protein
VVVAVVVLVFVVVEVQLAVDVSDAVEALVEDGELFMVLLVGALLDDVVLAVLGIFASELFAGGD